MAATKKKARSASKARSTKGRAAGKTATKATKKAAAKKAPAKAKAKAKKAPAKKAPAKAEKAPAKKAAAKRKPAPAKKAPAKAKGKPADKAHLLELYRRMQVIRQAEQRLSELFADGEVPGFIHLSIGQEAIAVGVGDALGELDSLASTHRGHGHILAKGVDLDGFFLEIMGKAEGLCRGRGGSMHVADLSVGMLGANGIVGAGIPIAVGAAMAHRVRKTGGVAAAFFGDGAMAEGVLHESFNMAALWKLPIVFVCENNGWSEFSPTSTQFNAPLTEYAKVFGIESTRIDGDDVTAVNSAAKALVAKARKGRPQVLECITHRHHGHFEGDPQKYRDDAELKGARSFDPLVNAEAVLSKLGVRKPALEKIAQEVGVQVDTATAKGRAGTEPDIEAARNDVYTPGAGV